MIIMMASDDCWFMAFYLCWRNSMIAEMGSKILFIMPYFSSTQTARFSKRNVPLSIYKYGKWHHRQHFSIENPGKFDSHD